MNSGQSLPSPSRKTTISQSARNAATPAAQPPTAAAIPAPATNSKISIDDFAKVEMRVGQVKSAEERMKTLADIVTTLALRIPQPPDDDVPPGKDAADNKVLYKWGEPRRAWDKSSR